MSFCGKCGTRNPDENKYCEKCGARLNTRLEQSGETVHTEQVRIDPEPVPEPRPKEPASKKGFAQEHTAVVAAIIALVVTLLLVAVCVDWNPSEDEDDGWTDFTGVIATDTPDGTYTYSGKTTYQGTSKSSTLVITVKDNTITGMKLDGKSIDVSGSDPSLITSAQYKDSPDWQYQGKRYHADFYRTMNGNYEFTIADQTLVHFILKSQGVTIEMTLNGWSEY